MRIILDTNVLISGLLKPHGPPAKILEAIIEGKIKVVVNDEILKEYREVILRPRFRRIRKEALKIVEFIESVSELAPEYEGPRLENIKDKGDLPFMEAFFASGADFIVTGNPRHFTHSRLKKKNVLTPREFLREMEQG